MVEVAVGAQGEDRAAGTRVELRLLGSFELRVDGRRVEAVATPRLESLVAYLALHQAAPLTRSEIAYALWPESGDAQALTNLRRELHALRRALPDTVDLLAVEHRRIGWRAGPQATVDATAFEGAVERWRAGDPEAVATAVQAYTGDLLPSCYDDWIGPHRERLRADFLEALEAHIATLEARRDFEAARRGLRRLLQADPLQERAYLGLMRIAAATGDRAAGLQAYHACAAMLRRELDVEPGADLQAAHQRLLTAEPTPFPSTSSAPSPSPNPSPNPSPSPAPNADPTPAPAPAPAPAVGPPPTPLIGRQAEWSTFTAAWREVRTSGPRLLVVAGPPGIGKTRLIEEQVRWAGTQEATAAYARSYEAEGDLAYGPVVDWLRAPQLRTVIGGLDPVWRAEIARLAPELGPASSVEHWQRRRLFDALVQAVRACRGPVLLALDDAQWADQDTLEWLHYLARAEPPAPALLVLGARSTERRANAPLVGLIAGLRRTERLTEMDLTNLEAEETVRLAAAITGRQLDHAAGDRLHRETEGHPLFIVEVARAGLDREAPVQTSDQASEQASDQAALPAAMQAFIAARLDQLSPAARHLIEVAAAVGRDFSLDLLARASDLEEPELVQALDELWQRGLIREDELSAYDIRHDRIREVAYGAISPIRRRLLHRRIGQALELIHAADLDAVAAHLAGQYEAAGQTDEAIRYEQRAAAAASRLGAYREAIRRLDKALALLRGLPPTQERDRRELRLLLDLAEPLNAAFGFASVELDATFARTGALARALGDTSDEVGALSARSAAAFVAGDFARSLELVDAATALLDRAPEHAASVAMSAGWPLMTVGRVEDAIAAFERALATHDPDRSRRFLYGFDAATFAMASESHPLWLVGREAEALDRANGGVERADASDDPHLRAMAHAYAAVLHQFRGDVDGLRHHAEIAMELCSRYAFAYYGEWAEMMVAWADRSLRADSVERIERALAHLQAERAEARRPYWLTILAEAHLAAGRPEAAAAVIDAALATAHDNDDRWWLPEIHRLAGELRRGPDGEGHLRAALAVAREQGSTMLAGRARASLRARRARTSGAERGSTTVRPS
ncbi:MAG TPA: AAA family ATPase [Candidatus Limnocylindrales bacterium]|nr:AAA family ATPase [Candidatus Limnocylindrales bacterium]